ncbi:MAG TPA: amidohydrolase family protein [Bryobacteraceae bacterium]|nr:amidohydrolase family protein [Bryobacteraceae bacterium]
MTRREFLFTAAAAVPRTAGEHIIDIHQHTNYSGRSNDDLVAHQRTMGATTTVLLPAGSKYGLAAQAGGNDTVVGLARQYPREFVFFANELPDIAEAEAVIRKYLKLGAIGIGEQKFNVAADSPHIEKIAGIAKEFRVPVLLHFQHGEYNLGIERFYRILDKYPTVNFIGHAQTWWGNIDAKHDHTVMYPKTPVTPGGITDRYLRDYPNIYGDLSAGSGQNALTRDEDHAREFIARHQNKLLFGSDCNDRLGAGEGCIGAKTIAAIRRLSPTPVIARKLLHDNAARLLKLRD